jgi:hypothetical protein
MHHPGIVKGKLDGVIVGGLHAGSENHVGKSSLRRLDSWRKGAYWKHVEAEPEVDHDGDIPVACRLFFRELDRRNGMSDSGRDDERHSTMI